MEEVARVLGPIEVKGKCMGRRWKGLTSIWPGAWLVSSCGGWLRGISVMKPKGSWVPVERALNVPLKSLNFILRAEASTCRIDSRRDPWGKGGKGPQWEKQRKGMSMRTHSNSPTSRAGKNS